MILLWGVPDDPPLGAVLAQLQDGGVPTVLVDQRGVRHNEVEVRVDDRLGGRLSVPGGDIDLEDVCAAYVRPDDGRDFPEVRRAGPGSPLWAHTRAVSEALWTWSDLCDAFVVNRPRAMRSNHSKPYQAALIQRHGFRVPETVVTTDAEAVLAFWQRHESVVYKSLSSAQSVVRRLAPADAERLGDVANCPTQFQQWVPGLDHRVHVIGDLVFCSTIASTHDDYRHPSSPGTAPVISPGPLPQVLAERCRALAGTLELAVAGIDLRLTPDGDWYCFEVNPAPDFTYYEQPDLSLARAVARLLASR